MAKRFKQDVSDLHSWQCQLAPWAIFRVPVWAYNIIKPVKLVWVGGWMKMNWFKTAVVLYVSFFFFKKNWRHVRHWIHWSTDFGKIFTSEIKCANSYLFWLDELEKGDKDAGCHVFLRYFTIKTHTSIFAYHGGGGERVIIMMPHNSLTKYGRSMTMVSSFRE